MGVQSGVGRNQQVYKYVSTDGCYFRNMSSYNYTVVHDESGNACSMVIWDWDPFLQDEVSF